MAQPRWWGWHQLDPRWAERLVAESGVGPGDLVLDVGAGTGALTAPLVDAGARVVAVELHPRRAQALRERFGRRIVVVEADAADLWLPRREFHVVANPPFGVTAALLTRLLGPRSRLETARSRAARLGGAAMVAPRRPRSGAVAADLHSEPGRADPPQRVRAEGTGAGECARAAASDPRQRRRQAARTDVGRGEQEDRALTLGMLGVVSRHDDEVTEVLTGEHEARHRLRGHG